MLALLALWAFGPGMQGGFLFDDYVNLDALGAFGPVRNMPTFLLYLTSGHGDPIGRPLAMLSFLLDGNDWPASAHSFLRTNILLHLLNGQLLTLVLLQLGRSNGLDRVTQERSAILGAALWLLHPLLLSTTLYVVQRECMLTAMFVLLGFLAWLTGRARIEAGNTLSGVVFLVGASMGCTLLGILCKANGALLPLLLLAAEGTVLPPLNRGSAITFRRIRLCLLVAPSIALVAAMAAMLPGSIRAAELRPWTLGQRLLTEPRVLFDYLHALVTPRAYTQSVFHDGFPLSTDLLHPWTTLPAIAGVLVAILAAWHWRRRAPLLSFAALFFFAGHLLEGSVITLELYFEHRNYLPAMPLFWPLAYWLTRNGSLQRARIAASICILLILAVQTNAGAQLWAKPRELALNWAQLDAGSARAQAYAAQVEMAGGQTEAAYQRLMIAMERHPDEAQLAFNLVDVECALGGVRKQTLDVLAHAIAASKNAAHLDFVWLGAAIGRAGQGLCDGLDLTTVERLAKMVLINPDFSNAPGRIQDIEHLQGRIFLARNQPDLALQAFDRALAALPRQEVALQQAALLASARHPDLALCHLSGYSLPEAAQTPWHDMQHLHNWLLQRRNYWGNEFAHFRAQAELDAQELGALTPCLQRNNE